MKIGEQFIYYFKLKTWGDENTVSPLKAFSVTSLISFDAPASAWILACRVCFFAAALSSARKLVVPTAITLPPADFVAVNHRNRFAGI